MEHKKVAIAYIPVIHLGYLSFIEEVVKEGVTELYLISDEILSSHEELDYINRKDRIRAVPHELMKLYLEVSSKIPILSLTIKTIFDLHEVHASLVAPKEDISICIAESYFGGQKIEYKNVFLRVNQENVGEEKEPQTNAVSVGVFEKDIVGQILKEATRSADWWRQVGAAIVKDGVLVAIAHNEHMPEEELPNILGDSRSLFKKGMNINYVTAAHAEVGVIAEAARKGIATEGASIFVTDFPCPYCARLIAKAYFKKVYYLKGYAVLDGDEFFKEMNVEVIKVNVEE